MLYFKNPLETLSVNMIALSFLEFTAILYVLSFPNNNVQKDSQINI